MFRVDPGKLAGKVLGKAEEIAVDTYNILTAPIRIKNGIKYRIGIIADLDEDAISKTEADTFVSYLKKGYLIWKPSKKLVRLEWDEGEPVVFKSKTGAKGRGMELSELAIFNGKLLTFDDRTGIIYEIDPNNGNINSWVTLMDGDGTGSKGFKGEWATVKNKTLYVGSHGKEWTTKEGQFVNNNPMWIKTVTPSGQIEHISWEDQYKKLRRALNIDFPGYVIHEAAEWSDVHQRWFFLPRKVCAEKYDAVSECTKGSNIMLTADQNFNKIEVIYIGEPIPTLGFSSFKFLPGTDDSVIVALKSKEVGDDTATYIMAFQIDGTVILPETKIDNLKYEGLAFI